MNIYIAGPMQGVPNFNYPAFHRAAAILRAAGHHCFNPAERDIQRHGGVDISQGNETGDRVLAEKAHGFDLNAALADDTQYICMQADAIMMLPGWEASKGAFAEWALARALGRAIIYGGI